MWKTSNIISTAEYSSTYADVLRCGRLLASSALQKIPLHDVDVLWCASLWMRFPCFLWSVVWPVDCELWPHYVWTLDMYFDSSHIVMDYLKILILCSCRFSINLRIKYIPTASRQIHVTPFFVKLIFSLRWIDITIPHYVSKPHKNRRIRNLLKTHIVKIKHIKMRGITHPVLSLLNIQQNRDTRFWCEAVYLQIVPNFAQELLIRLQSINKYRFTSSIQCHTLYYTSWSVHRSGI